MPPVTAYPQFMPIDELVAQSRAAAAADAAWLGSAEHLQLLGGALTDLRIGNVRLVWAPDGEGSYWKAASRELGLERPNPQRGQDHEDLAEHTALNLLHESLHVRFSTPSTFPARIALIGSPPARRIGTELFNHLEDARTALVAISAQPELVGPISKFLDAAVDELEAEASRTPDLRSQLIFAIKAYMLTPDRTISAPPAVAAELRALRATIDQVRRAPKTEDCTLVALQLLKHVGNFQL